MKELTVDAVIGNIEPVTDFITGELDRLHCAPKARMQLVIAVDEIFGNIARYAYTPGTGKATVRMEEKEPRSVVITFIDSGIPFDPLTRTAPDTHAPIAQRPIGGLGIFLVRKTMDRVAYEYLDGQNRLTITKTIA